jgi:hypothetical protein
MASNNRLVKINHEEIRMKKCAKTKSAVKKADAKKMEKKVEKKVIKDDNKRYEPKKK